MLTMQRFILTAAAVFALFNVAIAQDRAASGAGGAEGTTTQIAMGPTSAPQKRGPMVSGPNSDPSTCKSSKKLCSESQGRNAHPG
jgi:hypothetical protein